MNKSIKTKNIFQDLQETHWHSIHRTDKNPKVGAAVLWLSKAARQQTDGALKNLFVMLYRSKSVKVNKIIG